VLGIFGDGVYTPLAILFLALTLAAFVIEAWAFIDSITRPASAFIAAGKQTKQLWLILLGLAFVLGLISIVYGGGLGFLSVAAFVAAAVYHVDVRPKVREYSKNGKGRGNSNGPYGPW
jgi:hypothetical protein